MRDRDKLQVKWYARGSDIYADESCSDWVGKASGKQVARHIAKVHNAGVKEAADE